ncbi:MAG: hypothetical protein ACPGVK_03755 [Halocynthiibacter sp.]
MTIINQTLKFLRDDRGGMSVEWVLIMAFLAGLAIAVFSEISKTTEVLTMRFLEELESE